MRDKSKYYCKCCCCEKPKTIANYGGIRIDPKKNPQAGE